jgi:hypothetical protein
LKGLNLEDSGIPYSYDEFLETEPKKGSKGIKSKAPRRPKNDESKKALPPSSDIDDPFTLR